MLQIFRITAILEGISYLSLFAISMPLKYLAGLMEPNMYFGYAHGFLFMVYVVLALVLAINTKWERKKTMVVLLASLLPFATFYVEQKYFKNA